jgi:hypothetical protein
MTARTPVHTHGLEKLKAIMQSVCGGAEVDQTGPDHFRVTAPPEFIPQLVKARDLAFGSTCTVDFLARWS